MNLHPNRYLNFLAVCLVLSAWLVVIALTVIGGFSVAAWLYINN